MTYEQPDTKGPYAATCKICGQISPDDWETSIQVLKLKPETTVEEILQWWCEKNPHTTICYGPISIVKMEE
jgi:hypothetical protein